MNPHRILLAEDDDEMRALLAWWLRKHGFEVTECSHGIDLINRIDPIGAPVESGKFDLIISDIRMPGITGLEVLEDVRHCGTECPPVILITAFGDKETHQQARRLGAAAMFDKPFDFNELLAKVHELLPPRSLPGAGIAMERPPVEPAIRAGACSVPGSRKTNNENRCHRGAEGRIFLVTDGRSGMQASERASRIAIAMLSTLPLTISREAANQEAVVGAIRKAFAEANAEIAAISDLEGQHHDVGSTAVMALLAAARLYVAGLGGNRAYLIRDGQIEQLTADHSWAQALLDEGVLTDDEASTHRLRHVLCQYLGAKDDIEGPHVKVVELQPNDRFLLATVGLTNVVDDETILHVVSSSHDPQEAAHTLIQAAMRNGEDDGATCVTLFISRPAHCVVVDSDCDQCRKIAEKILALVNEYGYDDREQFAIAMALEEAIVNAVKHGNRSDPSKKVQIEYSVDAWEVRVKITDEGSGFDVESVPDLRLPENLDRPSGRGLLLMREFVSGIRFNSTGNQVELWKRRGGLNGRWHRKRKKGVSHD